MPITTSGSRSERRGGGGTSGKPRCWECDAVDSIYTIHPAYGYRVCRACVTRLGLTPVEIEPVEDEEPDAEA
jgi:hypothetical protein